jgi:nucleoside 2-deoxyribosyltransferase
VLPYRRGIEEEGEQVKVVYVAGPFRGPNAWEIAENVRNAERLALDVWRLGAACICPHANTAHFQDAAPDEVWLQGDLEILRRCDAMILTNTWMRSKGACAEREEAMRLEMPIFYTTAELKQWLEEKP